MVSPTIVAPVDPNLKEPCRTRATMTVWIFFDLEGILALYIYSMIQNRTDVQHDHEDESDPGIRSSVKGLSPNSSCYYQSQILGRKR
jgi:hypothetical protein